MKRFLSYKTIGQRLHNLSALFSYGGVALFLLLALMRTESSFSRQIECFIGLTLWLLTAALVTSIFAKRIKSGFTIVDLFFFLFFIYLTINHLFLSPVNASGKYLVLLLLGINYFSLRIIFSAYQNMGKFMSIVIVICGLVEAFLGIRQFLGMSPSLHSGFAMTGTFFNPGPYGGYLSVAMSIALYYLVHYHQSFIRSIRQLRGRLALTIKQPVTWIYSLSGLAFALAFIIFFGVMSRAAMVALGVSGIFILWHKRSFKSSIIKAIKIHRKKVLLFVTLPLILVGGVGIATYHVKKDSANGRLFLWQMSCNIIAEHPVTGAGFGTFPSAYAQIQADYFSKNPESAAINVADSPEYGFNEYLQLGAETGLIGLALFLLTAGAALIRLVKKRDALTYGMIALVVFAFFSYPFNLLPFQTLLALFIVAGATTTQNNSESSIDWYARILGAGICLILLYLHALTAETFANKVAAKKEWEKAAYLYRTMCYEESTKEYAVLYPLLKDDFCFLFEYGHALNKIGQYEQSNHILSQGCALSSDPMFYNIMGNNYKGLGNIVEAEKAYQHAFDILPNRLYPLYLLMKLHVESDQSDRTYEMAQKVMNFLPKIDSPAVRDMKREAKRLLDNNSLSSQLNN